MESEDYWLFFFISLLVFLIIAAFLQGIYRNPEVLSVMDSFLVGILVIITGYYAFTARKQTRIQQEQYEREIWKEFVDVILSNWKKQLELNSDWFQKDYIMFSQAQESAKRQGWLKRKLLGVFFELDNKNIIRDFYKRNDELRKEIEEYRLKVIEFISNYEGYMSRLLSGIEEKNLLNEVKRDWHAANDVFPWIVRKLLISEEQFENMENANTFIKYIWNTKKNQLEDCLKPFEAEGKRIGQDCAELAKLSDQLLTKINTWHL